METNLYDIRHYDYKVSPDRIAQKPAAPRDSSRLLVITRNPPSMRDTFFYRITELLRPGDLLVLNNTEVIKARLSGRNERSAAVEVLLLKEKENSVWEAMVKPGKRAIAGTRLFFGEDFEARVIDEKEHGIRVIDFSPFICADIIEKIGGVPLPPYIKKGAQDPCDYQTVYAASKGAVAAPTAGLHFTRRLLGKLAEGGVELGYVTLHCGLATFRPIKCQDIREHRIHTELVEVSPYCASQVVQAKERNSRVIAVGTTVVRSLESAAHFSPSGFISHFSGETGLYITPGYKFRVIDGLITNLHTPCSTNLVLVSSYLGVEDTQEAYNFALSEGFRFFSFGDAMLIL